MKGTLLNTATVAVGAGVGLGIGQIIPSAYHEVALGGLGLICLGFGVKMFLTARNVLIAVGAIALGGILGLAMNIQGGVESLSESVRILFGGEPGRFNDALIATSILFCVGPLTLLGCLQDGLEGKIELLAIKSTLDGIGAVFFAAALGPGVLATAGVVLLVQGSLTLAARPLRRLASDGELIGEAGAVGGLLVLAIGLGLLGIKQIPTANYLPAIFLAPAIVLALRSLRGKRPEEVALSE